MNDSLARGGSGGGTDGGRRREQGGRDPNCDGCKSHAVRWTAASRKALSDALDSKAVKRRLELPPHRYLTARASTTGLEKYFQGASWISRLLRPTGANLGLSALCASTQTTWTNKDRTRAVIEQYKHGAAIMEVYYINGTEMS
ncbi:hypothetical protein ACWD4P_34665 [Kitasatospora sp. NPDC002543]